MNNGYCLNCGEHSTIHRHHPDKEKWPNFTVPLCPQCHRDTHSMILVFFRPGAADEYMKWIEEQERNNLYIPLKDKIAKYKEVEFDERGQHRWW